MTDKITSAAATETVPPQNKKTLKKADGLSSKKKKDYLFAFLVLLYPMGLWAFFFFSTNIYSVIMAFQHIDYFGNTTFAGFDNFVEFLSSMNSEGNYLNYAIKNTLLNYLIPLFICMPLYIFFSYYIFKKTRGSKFVQIIAMVPRLVPGMVISLVFKRFVETALPSIASTVFGIENFPRFFSDPKYTYGTTLFYTIWLSFSTSLIVYPNAMNSIQQEIFESAQLDGVNNIFSELWYIILPLIYPTLETFLITGFSDFINNGGSLITFWLDSAPIETYNMGYYFYLETFRVQNEMGYPMLAAGGLIFTCILGPLTFLFKYLLEKLGPSTEK